VEKLKPYVPHIVAAVSLVTPAIAWVANYVITGAEAQGYIRAKQEIDERHNQALGDAIRYRALYDLCRDSTESR